MNACDLCQRDLPDDAGALCGPCMWAEVDNPRNQEWWA
jgi:hypothetical protein